MKDSLRQVELTRRKERLACRKAVFGEKPRAYIVKILRGKDIEK